MSSLSKSSLILPFCLALLADPDVSHAVESHLDKLLSQAWCLILWLLNDDIAWLHKPFVAGNLIYVTIQNTP